MLALKEDAVISLSTTQSESNIIFESGTFEDFVIIAKQHSHVHLITDVKKVNVIEKKKSISAILIWVYPLLLGVGITF